MEMGLVTFTPSKEYDVACLEDVQFHPKTKSIIWKTKKNLKRGDRLPVTTIIDRTPMRNVEYNPKKMDSMGTASAYANTHNIDKLTEILEQFKEKMVEMKEVLKKEERVDRESKRKYEDNISDYERLQQDYQILGEEWDTLKQSNMNLIKEKGELENKIADLEAQKAVANQREKQYEDQATELDVKKGSLEVLLKETNEQKVDIAPLTKQEPFSQT